MKAISKKLVKNAISLIIIVIFIIMTFMFFDYEEIVRAVKLLIQKPVWLLIMLSLYFVSFCLKAVAWKRYLGGKISFSSSLLGILYSLLINHLSPIKVGDLVRAEILHKRETLIKREEAFHSVIVLRLLDMICLIGIAFVGILALDITYKVPSWLILIALIIGVVGIVIVKKYFAGFLDRQIFLMRSALTGINGVVIFIATLLSWILEAGVLYGVVHILREDASLLEAAFVNSLTIAGQVFQVTPGGIANYESVMIFGLGMLGISFKTGYTIAVLTHGIKFFFSYIAGAFCLWIHPIEISTIRSWTKWRGVRGK